MSANCCTDQKVVTKLAFLEGKAQNFKKYIESLNPSAEAKTYIDSFQPELLVHTITTVIVPMVKLGQVETMVDELCTHLSVPDTNLPATKKKLQAYIQIFNDVLLQ